MDLDGLLRLAREKNASDIHLQEWMIPALRVNGVLVPAGGEEINAAQIQDITEKVLSPFAKQDFFRNGDADAGYLSADGILTRIHCFQSMGSKCSACLSVYSRRGFRAWNLFAFRWLSANWRRRSTALWSYPARPAAGKAPLSPQ